MDKSTSGTYKDLVGLVLEVEPGLNKSDVWWCEKYTAAFKKSDCTVIPEPKEEKIVTETEPVFTPYPDPLTTIIHLLTKISKQLEGK